MLLSSWPFAILITDYIMAALSSSSEVLHKMCEDLSSPKRVTVSFNQCSLQKRPSVTKQAGKKDQNNPTGLIIIHAI